MRCRRGFPPFRLLRLGRSAFYLSTVLLPLGAGCAQLPPAAVTPQARPALRAAAPEPETLPAPALQVPVPARGKPLPEPAAAPVPAPSGVPVCLDAVLRLAGEQNAQVRLARERVHEACAARDAHSWLPEIDVGTAYYRHEGGIQDEPGELIRSSTGALFGGLEAHAIVDLREITFRRLSAERRTCQQQGEASRLTSEKLLEASCAYVDLLAAHTGAAVFQGLQADLQGLLERVQHQVPLEPANQIEVPQIETELQEQRQSLGKAHEQTDAAAARLAYLLGLDPCRQLEPVEAELVPFDLVDLSQPVDALVNRALVSGPGVRELERLLALGRSGLAHAGDAVQWLPTLEVRMVEGAFGAGSGSRLDWDNRWDLAVQARWNLTALAQMRANHEVAESQMQQATLAREDLRGKLAAGVREARSAALGARERLELAQQQIGAARRFVAQSEERLSNHVTHAHTELLLARRSLCLAQLNAIQAVCAYNKAQLHLLILTGAAPTCP